MDDLQDIQKSRTGDSDAFSRLVQRHQNDIASRMWRFTRNRTELDELVQEVFVQAYLSLRTFRGEAPFVHWLNKIAVRTGYQFWRRQAAERSKNEIALDGHDLPGGEVTPSEAAETVHAILQKLEPDDRLVITLLHLDGSSVTEAAALTGWSESKVKVRAFRARNKLKALMELEKQNERA